MPNVPVVGTSIACIDASKDTVHFRVKNNDPNALRYEWRFKTGSGWGVEGSDSSALLVAIPSQLSTTVEARAKGHCGYTNWSTPVAVNIAAAAPDNIELSQSCLNIGTTDTITVTASTRPGEDYEWLYPGFTLYKSTNSYTKVFTTNIPVGTVEDKTISVRVKANGACGESDYQTATIEVRDPGYSIELFDFTNYPFSFPGYYHLATSGVQYSCSNCTYKWWRVTDRKEEPYPSSPVPTLQLGYDIITHPNELLISDVIKDGCRIRKATGLGQPPANHEVSLRSFKSSSTASKEASALKISPNPANDVIRGTLNDNGTDDLQIRLVSTSGKVVHTQTTKERTFDINVAAQPAGMYILVVNSKAKAYQEMVLINR
jgi:hypothetical protein